MFAMDAFFVWCDFRFRFNGIWLESLNNGLFRFAEFGRNSFAMTNDQLDDTSARIVYLPTINHDTIDEVLCFWCATFLVRFIIQGKSSKIFINNTTIMFLPASASLRRSDPQIDDAVEFSLLRYTKKIETVLNLGARKTLSITQE